LSFLSYHNPAGVTFNSKKENENIAVVPNIKDIQEPGSYSFETDR